MLIMMHLLQLELMLQSEPFRQQIILQQHQQQLRFERLLKQLGQHWPRPLLMLKLEPSLLVTIGPQLKLIQLVKDLKLMLNLIPMRSKVPGVHLR